MRTRRPRVAMMAAQSFCLSATYFRIGSWFNYQAPFGFFFDLTSKSNTHFDLVSKASKLWGETSFIPCRQQIISVISSILRKTRLAILQDLWENVTNEKSKNACVNEVKKDGGRQTSPLIVYISCTKPRFKIDLKHPGICGTKKMDFYLYCISSSPRLCCHFQRLMLLAYLPNIHVQGGG